MHSLKSRISINKMLLTCRMQISCVYVVMHYNNIQMNKFLLCAISFFFNKITEISKFNNPNLILSENISMIKK